MGNIVFKKKIVSEKADDDNLENSFADHQMQYNGQSFHVDHQFKNKWKYFHNVTCYTCHKPISFGQKYKRCKECKCVVHYSMTCLVRAPLPCALQTPLASIKDQEDIKSYCVFVPSPYLPAFVIHCLQELDNRGLNQPDLYQKIPQTLEEMREVQDLSEQFQQGESTPLLRDKQIFTIAATFIETWRNFNLSVIKPAHWAIFEHIIVNDSSMLTFKREILKLPTANRSILVYIILHLKRVLQDDKFSVYTSKCQISKDELFYIFVPLLIGNCCDLKKSNLPISFMERLVAIEETYLSTFMDCDGSGNLEDYSLTTCAPRILSYLIDGIESKGNYQKISAYNTQPTTYSHAMNVNNLKVAILTETRLPILQDIPVTLISGVIMNFLRSLDEPITKAKNVNFLLDLETSNSEHFQSTLKSMMQDLPKINQSVLALLVPNFKYIAKLKSEHSQGGFKTEEKIHEKMARNLAVDLLADHRTFKPNTKDSIKMQSVFCELLKIDNSFWDEMSQENKHFRLKPLPPVQQCSTTRQRSSPIHYLKGIFSKVLGKFGGLGKKKIEISDSSSESGMSDSSKDFSVISWGIKSRLSSVDESGGKNDMEVQDEFVKDNELFRYTDLEGSIEI